jgi:hypothetical protein
MVIRIKGRYKIKPIMLNADVEGNKITMNLLIMLILFVTLCFSCGSGCRYCDLAYSLMNAYSKEVRKTKGLVQFGSGGCMTTDVRVLSPVYISYRKLNIDGARAFYLEIVEGLINKANADEEIRPYLHNYPFTENNMSIDILFFDKKNDFIQDGFVASMSMLDNENGLIYYSISNSETEMLETIYIELYEDALKIVNEQKAKN